jgi:asparagine synthase (glutamine-hydrolysing)
MCGLVGFVGEGDRGVLEAMADSLAHRGPDDRGFFECRSERIFLGHRRLSIRDIEGGRQPMWNAEETVGVVYNGEIYNHVELRRELEAKGYIFRSDHSDTEVLVHGYTEWERELPAKLNGMFAFAVYDKPRRRIFLARDRFGEKPLYYAQVPGLFAFASELGAIALHPAFAARLNCRSLQKFFAYGYLPAPNALYENSFKLPGGCHLVYDLASGQISVDRYWRFRIDVDEGLAERSIDSLAEELRDLIRLSVERRLVSDVPIGFFLSGGIDSSAIVATAAGIRPAASLNTFTIGFSEPSFDESGYARRVANLLGTRHHEEILDMGTARDLMRPVLARMDEPLGDPSILPTYLLSGVTRKHVTVALSGDGGDELFAGYDPFAALHPARLYALMVPSVVHWGIRSLADLLPVSTRNMSWDFKIKRTLMGLSYAEGMWNPVWMSLIEPQAIADLFHQPITAEELYEEALALWIDRPKMSIVDKTLEFYANFYLQNDILTKVDRASMMHSLETRAVFLDNDLVEFVRRLPHRLKYRNGERKFLLKKAVAELLPDDIIRRKKKGFGIPLSLWLRIVPGTLPTVAIGGMNAEPFMRYWKEHRAGRRDHRFALWGWLAVQYNRVVSGMAP